MVGDISERMLRAVLIQLIRSCKVDEADIMAAADALDAEDDDEAAHTLRCIPLHAAAPSTSDWLADKRRRDVRERTAMIERAKPDGGNDAT